MTKVPRGEDPSVEVPSRGGEGRGKGTEVGEYPTRISLKQRRHLELQLEHYGTGVRVEFSLC